jgi:hypothetical protein
MDDFVSMEDFTESIGMFVTRYRHVNARLKASLNEPAGAEWQRAAKRMRRAWRESQGEDSLHEMAFGEP